ncbi:MAG: hypothetical protein J5644_01570 [Bacteroidales bacterium]|nr:hypothetical protein [Bacteroidales bacterium]
MKKIIVFFLILTSCLSAFSQSKDGARSSSETQTSRSAKEEKEDDHIKDKGFDIIFAGGCYFGSKYNAQYYNGDYANENNLAYLFENKYRYDEINKLIKNYYSYIDSIHYGGPLGNMKYRVSVMVSLGIRYKITKNWSVQLMYSFARLKANGQFRLLYEAPPGNFRTGMLDNQYILGKEDRSLIDLSACYLFTTKSIVKPFIEAGFQFNFVRVKSMDAVFYDDNNNKLGQPFSFINNLQNYVPGVQSDGTIVKYGGPGFGFSATVGIKLAFNQFVSLDPCFYFNAGKFGLEGYKDFSYNFGVLVRIIMNDSMFSK